jgi:hypothetical protein
MRQIFEESTVLRRIRLEASFLLQLSSTHRVDRRFQRLQMHQASGIDIRIDFCRPSDPFS